MIILYHQYVFEEGGLASDDYVEVLDFKRLANVNLVLGAINYEAWSSTRLASQLFLHQRLSDSHQTV